MRGTLIWVFKKQSPKKLLFITNISNYLLLPRSLNHLFYLKIKIKKVKYKYQYKKILKINYFEDNYAYFDITLCFLTFYPFLELHIK